MPAASELKKSATPDFNKKRFKFKRLSSQGIGKAVKNKAVTSQPRQDQESKTTMKTELKTATSYNKDNWKNLTSGNKLLVSAMNIAGDYAPAHRTSSMGRRTPTNDRAAESRFNNY